MHQGFHKKVTDYGNSNQPCFMNIYVKKVCVDYVKIMEIKGITKKVYIQKKEQQGRV